MTIINYTDHPLMTYEEVKPRKAQFWRGEVEKNVDYIVCDRPEIVEAYQKHGVIHLDKDLNPVEQPHDDYESLPWPKLKSLASKKAQKNVMTKQEALEILKE